MALDPRIGLETIPVDANLGPAYAAGVDIAKKKADIGQVQANTSQTQQQTQNLAAQQGGLQAASDIAKKNADYEKWLSENADKHTDDLPDGSKVVNGFKLMGAARNAGFYGQAQGSIQKDLTNIASGIKNSDDMTKATQVAAGYLGQMLDGLPPEKAAQLYSIYTKQLDQMMPPQTPGGAGAGTLLGPYNPDKIKQLKQMSMSPEAAQGLKDTQTRLSQSQQQINLGQQAETRAGVENESGPDYADPKNPRAIAITSQLKKLGYQVPDGLSLSELRNNQNWRTIIDSNINPASNRAAQQGQAIGAEQAARFADTAAQTAARIQIPAAASRFRIVDLVTNKINNSVMAQPDQDALRTLIEQAQANGIPINENSSIASIGANFRVQAGLKRNQGAASAASAKSSTFNSGTPAVRVRVMAPNGKTGTIAQEDLAEAVANGYKEVK